MKIFILGCGYLGYNLSKLLKRTDRHIRVLGIDSQYSKLCEEFECLDVFNAQKIKQLISKDAIVIDATGVLKNNAKSDDEQTLLEQIENNYKNLLETLQEIDVKQFIYFSSGGTLYGDSKEPASESFPIQPQTLYAKSKACTERIITDSGINYLTIRLANPFGGYQEPAKTQGVIPVLIRKALLNESFEMWAGLENTRDYVYITDFADALSKLIDNNINNNIINIGSGRGVSLDYLIELVNRYTNKEINIISRKPDVYLVNSIVLDISKLKALIDFKIQVSFEEGVYAEVQRIKQEMISI